jgi:hypothetical protein
LKGTISRSNPKRRKVIYPGPKIPNIRFSFLFYTSVGAVRDVAAALGGMVGQSHGAGQATVTGNPERSKPSSDL